jgi:hypothetical protein
MKHGGHSETWRTKTNKTTNRSLQAGSLNVTCFPSFIVPDRSGEKFFRSGGPELTGVSVAIKHREVRTTNNAAARVGLWCALALSRRVGRLSEAASPRHDFCPAAMASRSARRSRKLPGSTSTFCSSPALIIRQRVARLTPRSLADADIPRSKGPAAQLNSWMARPSRIRSIAPNCSGEASNSFFNRSFVFICVRLSASPTRRWPTRRQLGIPEKAKAERITRWDNQPIVG